MQGPTLEISKRTHAEKYRSDGETFRGAMTRIADALKDNWEHFDALRDILLDMRFLPGGRIQAAMGAPRRVTAFNCFVLGSVPDSTDGIMRVATEAAQTMRMGGGVGYDFSSLRPRGDRIRSLDSKASGPVSFMGIFDAVCQTIASAGHRRGAQMGVLRVDHPDILEFVRAKRNEHKLTGFNVSVAVTDKFMIAVRQGDSFDLEFGGRVYETVDARSLWDEIMRSTWDWAEPGVLFIDTINEMNNLAYCETIEATNPCGEQPLPAYGACLLGSFNMVKYLTDNKDLDFEKFANDIRIVVRAMDNVIDRTIYPLESQRHEALSKRRMGLGVTGVANAIEFTGAAYGSEEFNSRLGFVLYLLANVAYQTSAQLAKEKGAFPAFDQKFLLSNYVGKLDDNTIEMVAEHGIRNSHLISIAPTGTISLTADNVSSGIEPVFAHSYERTIITADGPQVEVVEDYGLRALGVKGKTAAECSVNDHLSVLLTASKWSDSAVSKTCNVGRDVSWDDFRDIYMRAWEGGAKGCTTFRASGKRGGILVEGDGKACEYDPETGTKTCDV